MNCAALRQQPGRKSIPLVVALTLLVMGCGGGTSSTPTTPTPPPAGPAIVAGPTVSSIVPSVGVTQGGTPITISGAGFAPGAAVTLGGTALNVNVLSSSSLTATAPANPAGTVDVVVTNPGTQGGRLVGGFQYITANGIFIRAAGESDDPTSKFGSILVVPIGSTRQLTAVLWAQTTGPVTAVAGSGPVTWISDNPAVASVSSTGLLSSVASGTATVNATMLGLSTAPNRYRLINVGTPGPNDGMWRGAASRFGPVELEISLNRVKYFRLQNVLVQRSDGTTCRTQATWTGDVPIVNGSFSGGPAAAGTFPPTTTISGTLSSATAARGDFSSFTVVGSRDCQTSQIGGGTVEISGGTWTATKQ